MAEPRASPLLVVEDLRVRFTGPPAVDAVRGIDYTIGAGESFGIVGESGSGKSASALALLGLLPSHSATVTGSARLEGLDLVAASDRELRSVRGARVGVVFQDPLSSLNPVLTVGRQITEMVELHTGLRRGAARRRAIELLELVGIAAADRRVDDYPHQFSGGMRQRAMIAMALSCEPALVIADEPTTALDVTVQAQIVELLRDLRTRTGMSILLISHDLGVIAGLAERVAVMYAGRIVETGPVQRLLKAPRHPYTVGLLRSMPRLDRPRSAPLNPIEGSPPDLSAIPAGCPFEPRCAWAIPTCRTVDPPLMPVAPDRLQLTACHNPPNEDERAA
jgi:oligopeptide/dipeptide ABC transporter ATP-binding protein